MEFFYDGQLRRYLAQLMRMLSGFKVQMGDGSQKIVPVMYGDVSRNVGSILRDNSAAKLPSAPKISVYVNGLNLDTKRLHDASYTQNVYVRERAIDPNTNTYLNTQGQNYTIERIMPTPFSLKIKADIWSSNTEQKMQILEQLLVLFNPSLEIQTTDNYVDWTSLTVVYLTDVNWSNRTIPVGAESEIDVATLSFETPIWISPPVKVKSMGVITSIIANIFNESSGTTIDPSFIFGTAAARVNATPGNYGIFVQSNRVKLLAGYENISHDVIDPNIKYGIDTNWQSLLDLYGVFNAGVSQLYLTQSTGFQVVGTCAIDPVDNTSMIVNWDPDTYPSNTLIGGRGSIDAIIDPFTYNPGSVVAGIRYLILNPIGSHKNPQGAGPSAWRSTSGEDFYAKANDIIEWDGTQWNIVFDSTAPISGDVFVLNLKTQIQYKWDGTSWTKSIDGEYFAGSWSILL
jgi:T4-like virus Myoviridae tail sheath stabiliser